MCVDPIPAAAESENAHSTTYSATTDSVIQVATTASIDNGRKKRKAEDMEVGNCSRISGASEIKCEWFAHRELTM